MLHPNFQLETFLKDNRMRTMYDWINSMTTLLEKIIQCTESRERIATPFRQISNSQYLEGVYDEIREADPITKQLRFTFIQSFLKISNVFLSMIPHSADGLMKIFERIELLFTKVEIKSPVRRVFQNFFTDFCTYRSMKKQKECLMKYLNR